MGWHADGRVGTVIPGVGVGRNLFTDPRLSSAGSARPVLCRPQAPALPAKGVGGTVRLDLTGAELK